MKISYFPDQTALNSKPVMTAFLDSCRAEGWSAVENSLDADAVVIWSVLWSGRMLKNLQVYNHYQSLNKPIFILEVGNLIRGTTWRVSLNNVNSLGNFGVGILDTNRPLKLGINLKTNTTQAEKILIACQRQDSLQWAGQSNSWLVETVEKIKQYTERPIVIRPHPRYSIKINIPNVKIENPKLIPETYDDFDLNYEKYHCVVNHNSGPGIQAAINGVHTICDKSSLAWPVSIDFSEIENPPIKDRAQWFLNLCHTEWTVDEIGQGLPLKRLSKVLFS